MMSNVDEASSTALRHALMRNAATPRPIVNMPDFWLRKQEWLVRPVDPVPTTYTYMR